MSAKFIVLFCLIALATAAPQNAVEVAVAPAAPVDICQLAPLADPSARCNNFSIRYYYDARTRDCEKIAYSGCGGSENLFLSEDACEIKCEDVHDRQNSFESVEAFDFDK